ncbi:MAG: MATE family efflux transporter [Deltaproteobacteria bacterium]|nr:MATE family efflux transporter [Deltaproteobacteria bacterium]
MAFNSVRDYTGNQTHLKEILRLGIPTMLALASQPLLNIGDTAMIGRLGVEPLAARAIGAALISGIYWIFAFLTFGTTTLIGHHFGADDAKACGETYLHALFVALVGGAALAAAGFFFAGLLYNWMGANNAVADQGISYFRITISSAPFTLILLASVGFFRGIQNTKTPMFIAFLANGLQLLLDYALIYGKFGLPSLGLKGAAIAAWIAQLTGASASLAIFFATRRTAAYRAISWRISMVKLRPLFRIGGDLALRTGALRLSLIFATGTAARMGAAILSAYEIAFQLFMLCSDVIDGLAVAGQALVARHLGAHQRETAARMGRILIVCGAVAGSLFSALFIVSETSIIQFFTKSPAVIAAIGGGLFLLVALMQPLNGIVFVIDGLLIGARDTRFLMWAMLAGGCGVFIPISWLSLNYSWGLAGILIGLSALMLWRCATNVYRFTGRKWTGGMV